MKPLYVQAAQYPLNALESSRAVEEILTEMDRLGVEVQGGPMSTFIRGEEELVGRKSGNCEPWHPALTASPSRLLSLTSVWQFPFTGQRTIR